MLFHRRAPSSSAGSVTGRPPRCQQTVHPNCSLVAAVRAHCVVSVAVVRSGIRVQWCAGPLRSCAPVPCAARVGQSHCAGHGTAAGWVAAAGGGCMGTAAAHRQILCPICARCVISECAAPSPRSLSLCSFSLSVFPFFFWLSFHFRFRSLRGFCPPARLLSCNRIVMAAESVS